MFRSHTKVICLEFDLYDILWCVPALRDDEAEQGRDPDGGCN